MIRSWISWPQTDSMDAPETGRVAVISSPYAIEAERPVAVADAPPTKLPYACPVPGNPHATPTVRPVSMIAMYVPLNALNVVPFDDEDAHATMRSVTFDGVMIGIG